MSEIDNYENIPSSGLSEDLADKYNGSKVKIAIIHPPSPKKSIFAINDKIVNGTTYKAGTKLPDGVFDDGMEVILETESYGVDNQGNKLTASLSISMKPWKGSWGFSTHEKSTAYKVCKMLKINHIKESLGKEVILVKTMTKKGNPKIVISVPQ